MDGLVTNILIAQCSVGGNSFDVHFTVENTPLGKSKLEGSSGGSLGNPTVVHGNAFLRNADILRGFTCLYQLAESLFLHVHR